MKHTQSHINTVITGVILILAASAATEVNAQTNTAQAVMEVRAEVVSGTHIHNKFDGDIAGQINQQEPREQSIREIDLGQFTITVPEGVEFSIRYDDGISMENGIHKWTIDTSIESIEGEKGEIIFNNFGTYDSGDDFSGTYEGTQKTTIEFN